MTGDRCAFDLISNWLAAAIAGGILALSVFTTALATPPKDGGCGSCGGGGGGSDPAARQQASQDAGNRSRTSGDSGVGNVSTGSGTRPSPVSSGDISALGAAMDAAFDSSAGRAIRGAVASNVPQTVVDDKVRDRLPGIIDRFITAADSDAVARASRDAAAAPQQPTASAAPAASGPSDAYNDLADNLNILDAALGTAIYGPGVMGISPLDMALDHGPPSPPGPGDTASPPPSAIITASPASVNTPPLGDTTVSASAVPPAVPNPTSAQLPPYVYGPSSAVPDPQLAGITAYDPSAPRVPASTSPASPPPSPPLDPAAPAPDPDPPAADSAPPPAAPAPAQPADDDLDGFRSFDRRQ